MSTPESEPSSSDPIESLFGGSVRYTDTATPKQVKWLIEETEAYVASFEEDPSRIKPIELFLQREASAPQMNRMRAAFSKAIIYLTGGFGGQQLLEAIRQNEEGEE